MRRSGRERELATLAWVGLAAYIFAADIALMLSGKKTMTEICEEALRHPFRRWMVVLAWGFTTKHLFARKFLPWLDPFGVIAGGAIIIKRTVLIGDKNDSRYRVVELASVDGTAILGGLGDQEGNGLVS